MLTIEELKRTFQGPNRADYPELTGHTREDIYRDCCGGGALYLAAEDRHELEDAQAFYEDLVLFEHEHNLDPLPSNPRACSTRLTPPAWIRAPLGATSPRVRAARAP